MFSGRVMIELVEEADGVPIIVAVVMSNGNVILEVFF
jgi:hypothetical protein